MGGDGGGEECTQTGGGGWAKDVWQAMGTLRENKGLYSPLGLQLEEGSVAKV